MMVLCKPKKKVLVTYKSLIPSFERHSFTFHITSLTFPLMEPSNNILYNHYPE